MVDKIKCPGCHKMNEVHKFCIYCGHELLDDDQIKLILDNPEPYCLNCGRKVEKGQVRCECGYELSEVNCPECNTGNSYTNRFCISCGKKLWTSDVYDYKYPQRLFEEHLLNEALPYALRNTSLYRRPQKGIGKHPLSDISNHALNSLEEIKSSDSKIDDNLYEIRSRWKIVSPNYCINCLGIIKPDDYYCPKCGRTFKGDKKRVESLKSENNYVKPLFSNADLKWTSKSGCNYLGSLAPAVGESQFEYRERLKWEFAENNNVKMSLKKVESYRVASKTVERQHKRVANQKGGYCGLSCRHCYEEFFDSGGGIVGDFDSGGYTEYYCHLGHPICNGRYCEDYE